jgi:hypothetical protein
MRKDTPWRLRSHLMHALTGRRADGPATGSLRHLLALQQICLSAGSGSG